MTKDQDRSGDPGADQPDQPQESGREGLDREALEHEALEHGGSHSGGASRMFGACAEGQLYRRRACHRWPARDDRGGWHRGTYRIRGVNVNPDEPMPGKVEYKQAKKFDEAFLRGQPRKATIATTLYRDKIDQLKS
jgi:hypothetical protein